MLMLFRAFAWIRVQISRPMMIGLMDDDWDVIRGLGLVSASDGAPASPPIDDCFADTRYGKIFSEL